MNFNSGGRFNQDAGHNGFFWNGMEYKMIVNVRELLTTHESLTEQLANFIFSENIKAVYDSILQTAFYDESDQFSTDDEFTVSILCQLMDSFGMKDEFAELIVLAFLNEELKLIEDAMNFGAILDTSENINLEDITDIKALFDVLDSFEMTELEAALRVLYYLHDSFGLRDEEPPPQVAGADWLIGIWGSQTVDQPTSKARASQPISNQNQKNMYAVNGGDDNFNNPRRYSSNLKLDPAYDYFLPFCLKVDANQTSIQVMPESEVVSVESPSVDGEMIADVIYKARLFNIVAYSELGLTVQEKEDLKTKIVNLLATTKDKSKSLLIQSRETKFDVRYQGGAEITEGPSFVRAEIPLWASVYGRKLFENEIVGSGLIKNSGSIPVGPRIFVVGPCAPFSFVIGGETYRYSSSVPSGCKLFMDFEMKSVWLENQNGIKENMLKFFDGKFQKVPAQESLVITVPSAIQNRLHVHWVDPVLW